MTDGDRPNGDWLLRSLGQAEVLRGGVPVAWPARSAEELLWYLHAHPDGRYRHDLLRDLWDLEDTPAAANRFRVALHRLRQALDFPEAVTERGGRYALHPDLLAASDTAALHRALHGAREAELPRAQEELLRRALACAAGEYLPHLTGEWVQEARQAHRAAVVEAHLTLSQLHCAARECPLAAQDLVRAAQTDPLIGEDHHQRLMACLAMTRDRYAATEYYRRYRQYLLSEIGDTPLPETVAFAERLKGGELPCVNAPFRPAGATSDK
ncbi:AfsR/SARP family transcriptional regulator [Deinococcus sp. PEB2-63]